MGQISIGQWPPSHELDHLLGAANGGKSMTDTMLHIKMGLAICCCHPEMGAG